MSAQILLRALERILPDPEPPLVFEIGDRFVTGVRRSGPEIEKLTERPLRTAAEEAPGDTLEAAVAEVMERLAPAPSAQAALLLPDSAVRLALVEFEAPPRRKADLRAAVEARFRKSLPYSLRSARVSYRLQGGSGPPSALAVAARDDYVRSCERTLERAGLLPGWVEPASVAALNLVADPALTLVVSLAGESMTMAAVEGGAIRLIRRVALSGGSGGGPRARLAEIERDLFPTLVYLEERLGASAARVQLSGPPRLVQQALQELPAAIGIETAPLADPEAARSCCAGLLGYVHG